jgi:hypothetical protein
MKFRQDTEISGHPTSRGYVWLVHCGKVSLRFRIDKEIPLLDVIEIE